MRKVKSSIAIFVGFCLWQTLRLFLPELEVHPIFIYIYGMIEFRETSEKTKDYGRMRIMATFTAIAIGLLVMLLTDWVKPMLTEIWIHTCLEISVLMAGALLVLCVAEWVKCRVYCGLAAAIYMILMISHFESSMYLYSIMRAFQTIIGVSIAWFINASCCHIRPNQDRSATGWVKDPNRRNNRISTAHPIRKIGWANILYDLIFFHFFTAKDQSLALTQLGRSCLLPESSAGLPLRCLCQNIAAR